ncbi:plastocyanin/azurin family copper-binding protein [Halomarina pelagica]|uniref:plastocyanin/azurin family copper-binding protein n=1 Tax=Halomarina pelagica TaxID=2961599 RepID=UPI0020C4B38E|nr:plastocyanin/azurin family copper-binding protein [Halomarina sp. BND7]
MTIDVGERGLAFDPVAVHVDPGTRIVWKWTGRGTAHNVAAQRGATFASDIRSSDTYEWVAEGGPIVAYQCDPHAGQGMRGVVVVE